MNIRGPGVKVICLGVHNLAIGAGKEVLFARHENLVTGPLITTAHRKIFSEDLPVGKTSARPSCCGEVIPIPDTTSERIDHWSMKAETEGKRPAGGFTDALLLMNCPSCSTPLRINPFYIELSK
jgi:hypothetical protein